MLWCQRYLALAQHDRPRAAALTAEWQAHAQQESAADPRSSVISADLSQVSGREQAAEGRRTAVGGLEAGELTAKCRPVEAIRVGTRGPDRGDHQSQLDVATFTAAWAEGRAMTLEQAIADALSMLAEPPARADALLDSAGQDRTQSSTQWRRD